MQDAFVGDIGDYGKYGLLRALTGMCPDSPEKLSLGVLWYVPEQQSPGGAGPGRGAAFSYLDRPKDFRPLDPSLFDSLSVVARANNRSLEAVRASGVLGGSVSCAGLPINGNRANLWTTTSSQDSAHKQAVVFLDPDNGLTTKVPPSSAHASLTEVAACATSDQTVVVYHHLPRINNHNVNVEWREQLEKATGRSHIRVIRAHRWFPRTFFVIPSKRHRALIDARLDRFVNDWGTCVEECTG